jgi:cell division septal protein FtsQ
MAKPASVAGGTGSRNRPRPRTRASTAVSFPRARPGSGFELAKFAPSGRSLLIGLLILLTALGLYAAARGTSAFAVRTVAVEGASPAVAAEVRTELSPALGESLLGLDLTELEHRAKRVPMVADASFDRAFPHTLRIAIVPEVPVAVLRQGSFSWLVADGGRVVAELDRGAHPGLPRIWLKRDVEIRLGEAVGGMPLRAIDAVAPLGSKPLPLAVASAVATRGELKLVLRNGLELRLGDSRDLPVKLEVARRVIPRLGGAGGYLDVSVPDRPVAGETLNSQVEVETSDSALP